MAKKKYTDEQRRKRIIELAQRRIGITAPEIMDTFQVDLQTVWRDVAAIRSANIDIQASSLRRANGRVVAVYTIPVDEEGQE